MLTRFFAGTSRSNTSFVRPTHLILPNRIYGQMQLLTGATRLVTDVKVRALNHAQICLVKQSEILFVAFNK